MLFRGFGPFELVWQAQMEYIPIYSWDTKYVQRLRIESKSEMARA